MFHVPHKTKPHHLRPLGLIRARRLRRSPAGQAREHANDGRRSNACRELKKLFADSDEASLKLSPIGALFRGDQRYADQFGDYISDEFIEQQRRDAASDLKRLHAIDRASLTPQDQLAYDVFEYQTMQNQAGLSPEFVALTVVRPLNHLNGLHIQYPDISSGKSAARFQTVADFDNGLKRIDGFVLYLDRASSACAKASSRASSNPS